MKARVRAAIMVTIMMVGGVVVTAPPAQAMSIRHCWDGYVPGVWGVYMWEDYNWWEETFQGKHDRWVWRAWMRCA